MKIMEFFVNYLKVSVIIVCNYQRIPNFLKSLTKFQLKMSTSHAQVSDVALKHISLKGGSTEKV